jgi:hypothetical protein
MGIHIGIPVTENVLGSLKLPHYSFLLNILGKLATFSLFSPKERYP